MSAHSVPGIVLGARDSTMVNKNDSLSHGSETDGEKDKEKDLGKQRKQK